MTRFLIPSLLFSLVLSLSAQSAADPKPVVDEVIAAAGGRDKLLTLFQIEEIFHFGDTPEPAEGKKRSTRISVIEPPKYWWLGKKEREDEPAKFDVWAWTLGIFAAPESKVEVIPDLTDEGKTCLGLKVSGSVTPAMDFYFDKQTKLLHRLDWRGDIYRFSNWKEHDGAKYASRTIIYKKASGKPWFFHEVTGIERLKELPAGLVR
ncbi:hypothetical protein [Brevifollis gellanilyticus]|uniref:Lipoprotein n=1 Tax=Brevifollis gellanilyticus TaxID=748831 RepID=A0A512M9J2_9BACT|nr:hypothetical protein [Brevifollis gellanilyticus]GEP43399.1 hypothetical protein BGE01nite_26900 [Brevifollis gellanilyticus]